ncbi:hypothetical protein ACFSCV_08140 [Methylopila henanensis]|uniref:Uncharacterized protein n=1 Tax=Methylopila henanensis TaxID=873516 RepID=A0ABW4K470_9HYPH
MELVTCEGLEFDGATLMQGEGVIHVRLRSAERYDVYLRGVAELTRLNASL